MLLLDAERHGGDALGLVLFPAQEAARHHLALHAPDDALSAAAAEVNVVQAEVPPARDVQGVVAVEALEPTAHLVGDVRGSVSERERDPCLGVPDQRHKVQDVAVRDLAQRRGSEAEGEDVAVVAVLGLGRLPHVHREGERRGGVRAGGAADRRAGTALPYGGGEHVERSARRHLAAAAAVAATTELALDAVDEAQGNCDVGGRHVSGLAADECLSHGGYWRGEFREGVVHPHRQDGRGRGTSGKLADGLQELRHAGAVREDVVPRHPDNEAATGKLGHLHQQKWRVLAVLAGIADTEVLDTDHGTPVAEPGVLQGAARRRTDERYALAGARELQLVPSDGEAAGHWVVGNKRTGQSSSNGLGRTIDGVLVDEHR